MDVKKLAKIKKTIEDCRGKLFNIRPRDLKKIATALGRQEVDRGKEPTYESQELDTNVITIPQHGARTVAPGTARNILDQLENDVFLFEEQLEEQSRGEIIHEHKYSH